MKKIKLLKHSRGHSIHKEIMRELGVSQSTISNAFCYRDNCPKSYDIRLYLMSRCTEGVDYIVTDDGKPSTLSLS